MSVDPLKFKNTLGGRKLEGSGDGPGYVQDDVDEYASLAYTIGQLEVAESEFDKVVKMIFEKHFIDNLFPNMDIIFYEKP